MTEKINTSKSEVRKFGLLFGVLAAALSSYLLYKSNAMWAWVAGASFFFFVSGLFATAVLRPMYVGWMKFAFWLGWINTRILLGAFFFLILTPVAVVLRLLGKDLLDQHIDSSAKSYWKRRPREDFDRGRYEHLF